MAEYKENAGNYLLFQLNEHYFGTIEYAGQPGGFPCKAPADDHSRAVHLVQSASIFRKPALIGRIQAIHQERDAYLPAMGMAGNDQVEGALGGVLFDQFRPVSQEDREALLM